MAKALPAGRPIQRRALFGLFDADGWGWAISKALFWLAVIVVVLGYVPDRAYYFVVSRTLDIVGTPGVSLVNLCPPENGSTMPCPVPAGGILPWQISPPELSLPQPRTGGVAAQLGTSLLYVGGSDGKAPSATTYVTKIDKGAFGTWSEGPALPAARDNAALAILSGTIYLAGGLGPDGAPTDTLWSIAIDPDTNALKAWTPVKDVKLPAPRTGAAAVAVADGIVIVGGRGADNKVTSTVWKATVDAKTGALGPFKDQPPLPHGVTDASIALSGTYLWVYGGADDAGPVGAVQRADYGAAPAAAGSAAPSPSAAPVEGVIKWATRDAANLPVARTDAAGFVSNGALYLVGGTDGARPRRETYWAIPNSAGDLAGGWHHLDATDLPGGLVDAAPVVAGATAILIGGTTDGGPLATSTRANLAPAAPFFELGLIGVVVPGLQIGGQIGTQLGYLAAAGVGTGNFVILVIIGWAFNHKAQISAWRDRRRRNKAAKAPKAV